MQKTYGFCGVQGDVCAEARRNPAISALASAGYFGGNWGNRPAGRGPMERFHLAYATHREDACPIFARFLKAPKEDAPESENWKIAPKPGTVYLVCTSAGEVGVNISADHLVCDLSTFDSMAQRFGRVNRFGDRDDTRIDVVCPKEFDEKDDYEARLNSDN
jgi:hypothetical protein